MAFERGCTEISDENLYKCQTVEDGHGGNNNGYRILLSLKRMIKKIKHQLQGHSFTHTHTHTHTHPNFSTKKKTAKQPITKVNPVTKKGHHWLLWGFHFGTENGGVLVLVLGGGSKK